MKTDRLLSITLYLINRKKATARELAGHFEVSHRTIQRDMDSLALAGIPVYAERGKEGGYRIMESCTVNRHFFAPEELSALTSLVSRLNSLLEHSDLKKTEEKLLNLAGKKPEEKIHNKLIMDFTPWGVDAAIRERFQAIYRAVEENRVIHIQYASPTGDVTERDIEPLSVIIKGSAWYVYGFCRLRADVRLFKVTRIMVVRKESLVFNPDVHPPYDDEENGGDQRKQTLFVLKFAPSAQGRVTDYYNADSLHFMPDGTIMGFFPFPEDEWVYSWILSFGSLVEVLEPPHAKKRIKEMVAALSGLYK